MGKSVIGCLVSLTALISARVLSSSLSIWTLQYIQSHSNEKYSATEQQLWDNHDLDD